MSTTAEIERKPERSMRCCIHAGVGALASMLSMTRAAKRGQAPASSMRTPRVAALPTGACASVGSVNGAPVIAETSRAMPTIDRQSGRFGVSLIVISASSSASVARTSCPGVASEGSTSSPDASSAMPSSRAEHSMPCDSTPRTVVRVIDCPPGSVAPSSAQGTRKPFAAFGAPQTTCNARSRPTSTVQTRSRSASGCGATCVIVPTTTCAKDGAARTTSSTSKPAIVSLSHNAAVSIGGSTSVRNHRSENFMPGASSELREEAQVVLVEQAQVVDAVAQHREAIGSDAERESLPALGIDVHRAQHVGMHLSCTRDLQPAAVAEAHVDFRRRLGEWKERRPEAQRQVVALEEVAQERAEHRLQIRERHIVADPQSLHLMEHR